MIFIVHNNNKHVFVKKEKKTNNNKHVFVKKKYNNSKHVLVCELDLLYN